MAYRSRRKGMRVGAKHKWTYSKGIWKETKTSPRMWKFSYTNSKYRRGRKAPRGTGMPVGSKLHWKIRANQYALKTGANTYKLIMRGTKYRAKHSTTFGS